MGQRVIFRSTFEIDFGQKDLWEMTRSVIAQGVCSIEFVGQSSSCKVEAIDSKTRICKHIAIVFLERCLMPDFTLYYRAIALFQRTP
jgi:hypothetical protein